MNRDEKLAVARLVLKVCEEEGYQLAGSLAQYAHGVEGAREPDDVDLFTDKIMDAEAVRERVGAALREHGYEVEVTRTWFSHPFVAGDQCADLKVTDSEQNSVVVQMARMPRYFESHDVDGMPVAAIGDLLYNKMEAPENRIAAKDYLDLVALTEHLGQPVVDSYVADYVTGMSEVRGVPKEQLAEEVYLRLSQVADVPDQAFAGYQVQEESAALVRAAVLDWAARITPASSQHLEPRLAAGLDPLPQAAAVASLDRLKDNGRLALRSTAQLSTMREKAVRASNNAHRELNRMTEAVEAGGPIPEGYKEAQQRARTRAGEVTAITAEMQRRAGLSSLQRAEEAVTRRAVTVQGIDMSLLAPSVTSGRSGISIQPSTAPSRAAGKAVPASESGNRPRHRYEQVVPVRGAHSSVSLLRAGGVGGALPRRPGAARSALDSYL
ncbi:hypothetical protein F7Q99_30910 [Streptomyces kaniharaensis]|uniref:Uncharacterized protein n=1 Tax=Streptomyces kaniharaensis TaxID=212423 RepID=A0A6N7L1B5_9ACTN|nr:hypothetical protein [Streptomyces kaniharaensis]MQS16487.1 hypothetical protein [Streptomyces kaniharaensis]